MYGGSLALHTTVNRGVKLLKPVYIYLAPEESPDRARAHTTNREFRAASDELEELAALGRVVLAHDLQQVANRLAVHVKAMIRLHRVHQS